MEESVNQIIDLEGLNSELDGLLSDLHGREEALSARVKILEEELSEARAAASSAVSCIAEKETSFFSVLEDLRALLREERAKVSAVSSERDGLLGQLRDSASLLEEERAAFSEKDALIERLKRAVEQERTEKAEGELRAENVHALLRAKQEDFMHAQKLVEQLRDKLRLWKSKQAA